MDVSVMLVRRLDDICWSAISDSSTPYEVAGMAQQMREHPGQMLNSFISCRKGNPFIHRCMSTMQLAFGDCEPASKRPSRFAL